MIIFSSIVYFTPKITLFRFLQSYTSLFGTLLHNNYIFVSKSGLTILIIYNRFATNEQNILIFYSFICFDCLLPMNILLDADVVTYLSISYPNASIASKNCTFISILNVLSSVIFIFISKNVCFFPLVTTNSPNCF